MKCLSLSSFFHLVEKMAQAPCSGVIMVRCSEELSAVFKPYELEQPLITSLHFLERQAKNQSFIFCLSSSMPPEEEQCHLLEAMAQVNKTIFWIVPDSLALSVAEKMQRCFHITVGPKNVPQEESVRLRELLLPYFTNLPQRQTPDTADYLQRWLQSFIAELKYHGDKPQHDKHALEAIEIILKSLEDNSQPYLVFRQIKWALYRYMRSLKK